MWPDWAIYWTLGNFSKHLATIVLPKLPTFHGNFVIFHFSSKIIFGQVFIIICNFFLVTLGVGVKKVILSSRTMQIICTATLLMYLFNCAIASLFFDLFSVFPIKGWLILSSNIFLIVSGAGIRTHNISIVGLLQCDQIWRNFATLEKS